MIIGMWYKASEQPLRLESYYCTNGIATMFGGLLGYAIGNIKSGLPQWMYVFLIFGTLSLVAGVWSLLVLPDSPSTCKFLNERERIVAVERVAGNRQGVKNHNFKAAQAWQTLYDPKTWILFVMAVAAQVPNSALTSVSHSFACYSCARLTSIPVRLHHRGLIRLRHTRHAISPNTRRSSPISRLNHWWIYLHQVPEHAMHNNDDSQHHMHHWIWTPCWAP